MMNFSALAATVVDVKIEMPYNGPDGKPRLVFTKLKIPTYHEWNEVALEVPLPDEKRYHTALDADNKPVFNPQDPDYRRALAHRNEEIEQRRVVKALEGAGIAVPGNTLAEKTHTYVTTVDVGIGEALHGFLISNLRGGRARTLTTAEASSFLPNGSNGATADLPGAAPIGADERQPAADAT